MRGWVETKNSIGNVVQHCKRGVYEPLCDTGLTGDVSEPGGAPDIVLPHQDAQFVQHIAMDIGGSLIKLVYFSSGDDDDGVSSEALGSDECESSVLRTQDHSSAQRPSSPSLQPCLLENQHDDSQCSSSGAGAAAAGAREYVEPVSPGKPTAQQHSRAHHAYTQSATATESPSVSPTRSALSSHPISACDAMSNDALPECVHDSRGASCDAARPDSPAHLDAGDPTHRDSLSTSSDKGRQGGRLHFVKFESTRINDAINFIEQKQLHCRRSGRSSMDGPLFQVRFSPSPVPLLHPIAAVCSLPRALVFVRKGAWGPSHGRVL